MEQTQIQQPVLADPRYWMHAGKTIDGQSGYCLSTERMSIFKVFIMYVALVFPLFLVSPTNIEVGMEANP